MTNLLCQVGTKILLERALAEDVGHGDLTTAAIVPPDALGTARIVVKDARPIVLCGTGLIEPILSMAGASPGVILLAEDGTTLKKGDRVAEIEGRLQGLLTGERTVLNFVALLSGIATLTHAFVKAVAGSRARIIDTRKTHPGLRTLEKYAVRVGGGHNHRFALDSGILIKENHIAAAGSISAAIERVKGFAPHTIRIEVECESVDEVQGAVDAGADAILLDNMELSEVKRARRITPERVMLEVSGGVTMDTVARIAATGVDLISVGALTHSAPAVDLSMGIEPS